MKLFPLYILALCALSCQGQPVQHPDGPVHDVPTTVTAPASVVSQPSLPTFQASWGLKLELYNRMNQWLQSRGNATNYVGIVDFSQHSSKKRFYLFDLKAGTVERHNVSHGSGSDRNNDGLADTFSNQAGSNASSLGMAKTAETYNGKHGYSLRLDGLESTNSNIRSRDIVMHSATYVHDGGTTGRSWGCTALDPSIYISVIDRLKGGSFLLLGN